MDTWRRHSAIFGRGGPRHPSSGLCWESQETPRPWKFHWQLVSACRDSRLMSLHSAGFYQSNSIATAASLHELGHDFVCCIMARLTLSLTTHSQQPLQHTHSSNSRCSSLRCTTKILQQYEKRWRVLRWTTIFYNNCDFEAPFVRSLIGRLVTEVGEL